MRKILMAFLVLMMFSYPAYSRPTLAVREFDNKTDDDKVPAGAVMNMMVTELYNAGLFDLVEREKLKYAQQEYELAMSGLMNPKSAAKFSSPAIEGARYQMSGAITLYHYFEKGSGFAIPIIGSAAVAKTGYVCLEIQIMDTVTSNIIYAAAQEGSAKRAAKGAITAYKGFFIGGYKREYEGILASATREAVMKHVAELKKIQFEE